MNNNMEGRAMTRLDKLVYTALASLSIATTILAIVILIIK